MTKTHRILLAAAMTTAMLVTLAPSSADADSRRHVLKPGETVFSDGSREADTGGAPEINGTSLGLGLALALGGLAILTNRRRADRA